MNFGDCDSVLEVANDLFSDDLAIDNAEEVCLKLKLKERLLGEEIKEIIRGVPGETSNGTEELEIAKSQIHELFTKISQLKVKSINSEQLVDKITKDLKSLDYSKKNLVLSISALQRFQMLVKGSEQIRVLTEKKKYSEINNLVLAVIELINFFQSHKGILKVNLVLKEAQLAVDYAKSEVCEFFFTKFPLVESNKTFKEPLQDACLLLDCIPAARDKVMEWYIDYQLKEYRSIFNSTSEISGLENTSRRLSFLKRIISSFEQHHQGIFPPQWFAEENVCMRFCTETRSDFSVILSKSQNIDVKLLIKTLKETIQLESQLATKFIASDFKFNNVISSCFEPYLTYYIETEDSQLNEFMEKFKQSIQDSNSILSIDEQVLPSSSDLFFIYRQSLNTCGSISNKKPLVELAHLFEKYLSAYSKELFAQVNRYSETGQKTIPTEMDFKFLCVILNTADYCQLTVLQLEEKVKEKIDDQFKDLISFEVDREHYMSLIALCLKSLSKGIDLVIEPHIAAMNKIAWSNVTVVGDQSQYIAGMGEELLKYVPLIRSFVISSKYFKSVCDKVADQITNKFYLNLFKLKQISEIGAEQLLLDTQSLKKIMMEVPTAGTLESATAPSSYIKIVNKGIAKAENLLKSVIAPIDQPEGFVENYILLNSDISIGQFQKVLELKGVKKLDQTQLVDAFVRKLPTPPSGQSITGTATNPTASGLNMNIPSLFSTSTGNSSLKFNAENLRKMAANMGFKKESNS